MHSLVTELFEIFHLKAHSFALELEKLKASKLDLSFVQVSKKKWLIVTYATVTCTEEAYTSFRGTTSDGIGLLQLTITWYKIRHAGGQAHYYSHTGTSKQRQVNLHWFRSLCFNVPVRE